MCRPLFLKCMILDQKLQRMLNDSKIAQLNSERPLHQTAVFNGLCLISCVLLFSWTQRTHISNLTLKTNYQGKACDFSIAGRSLSVELKKAKLLEIKLAIFLQNNILERWNWNQNLFCFAFSVIFTLFWRSDTFIDE